MCSSHCVYHLFPTTVVIIFLTVPILRPPLNFLCRPIMCYSLISLQLKLYFRHSCTFCTPHFFYINSNKPTAGRTKAIHRRLELSFNLYLLLLFVGQNRASKSLLHITPRISRFLQSFQQIKLLKDNSSCQNPLVIVVFLG